jgi:predicted DNA-binding transcriptional regulator AlpA
MDRGIGSRAQDAQDTLGCGAEAVHLRSGEELNLRAVVIRATAHLIRVPEAARLTGLPRSLLRKSFMSEDKRPKNVPPPPPHKRIGRAVYILSGELPAWIKSLGKPPLAIGSEERRRGRPTVAERIMRRQHEAAQSCREFSFPRGKTVGAPIDQPVGGRVSGSRAVSTKPRRQILSP